VAAEEKVFSAREIEIAQRRKEIDLIGAAQEIERETQRLQKLAAAEKQAAVDRSSARQTAAEGEAEADKIRALAAKIRYEIEATGARQMNEAQNILTPDSRAAAIRMKLIEKLDAIIRESAKPMEKIESIKILQVDGLSGGGGVRGDGDGKGGVTENLVNQALRYRAQAPLIDALLKEIGIPGGDINKLAGVLGEDAAEAPVVLGRGKGRE
jgi:uncharacterized membrane protein YqiK